MAQINKATDYFNTVLYNGSASTQNITGVNFQPDLVWIKTRSHAESHQLVDQVRGATKALMSNETSAEATYANGLSAFLSDGFTLPGGNNRYSDTGYTYVSWNWKAGGTGVSNTDGSITSTVSANTTSGFSIVKWTGTGANGTIGHGLGVAPKMIIVKANAVKDWMVGHNSMGWTKYINLNTTSASSTASTVWQDTAPTSSVFSVGSSSDVNTSSTSMIAYCFAEKKGFSKFGSYTGNGSADGTFVYTGFKPAFVIIKRTDDVHNWWIWDNKRDPSNLVDQYLYANLSNAEGTDTWGDFLSNGFKLRMNYSSGNASGGTYIYMAFAESPFTTSTGIPTTAR